MDFDLDLAVREDSENPVYYVQYAHARICTLVARLAQEGYPVPAADQVQGEVLTAEEETALVRTLAKFPEEIHTAARDYDPSRINRYLTDLAGDFHRFYGACRIKGEEPALLAARLKLADSVRSVLANGLNLLGVHSQDTAIIGDRMDTDIVAGIECGLDTVLVLSGVTDREGIEHFPYRPRLVLNGVGDIPAAAAQDRKDLVLLENDAG